MAVDSSRRVTLHGEDADRVLSFASALSVLDHTRCPSGNSSEELFSRIRFTQCPGERDAGRDSRRIPPNSNSRAAMGESPRAGIGPEVLALDHGRPSGRNRESSNGGQLCQPLTFGRDHEGSERGLEPAEQPLGHLGGGQPSRVRTQYLVDVQHFCTTVAESTGTKAPTDCA